MSTEIKNILEQIKSDASYLAYDNLAEGTRISLSDEILDLATKLDAMTSEMNSNLGQVAAILQRIVS